MWCGDSDKHFDGFIFVIRWHEISANHAVYNTNLENHMVKCLSGKLKIVDFCEPHFIKNNDTEKDYNVKFLISV